jgi:GTPase
VGLVGLPNAGKSTLLAVMTAARPKIADYPFTTLSPNLGVAGEDPRVVLADVPGLIEGAHQGRGLGHRFLRHVARCRVLAYVVDLAAEDPVADLRAVREEVAAFDPDLVERPWVIAATKSDLLDAGAIDVAAARLREAGETVVVSGATGGGVEQLAARLAEVVASAPGGERQSHVVLRPGREPFTVRRVADGRFVVEGRSVERWVRDTDLEDPARVRSLQDRLRRAGVERRLEELGARRGDEVTIAGQAFGFIPEG